MRHRALLSTAKDATDVTVEGAGADGSNPSVIDGNGWPWWARFVAGDSPPDGRTWWNRCLSPASALKGCG